MMTTVRLLGLDAARWSRVRPDSVWSGAAVVVVASTLLALNRFGGLASTTPRAFMQLVLIGIWGWIALALILWVLGSLLATSDGVVRPLTTTLLRIVAVVGLAYAPVIVLTVVVFVAADVMQLFGPGLVTAVVVFGAWLPAWLLAGTKAVLRISLPRTCVVVAASYGAWLHVVGRYLLGQIGHLL